MPSYDIKKRLGSREFPTIFSAFILVHGRSDIFTFYDGYQVTSLQKMREGNVFMVGRWVEGKGREIEGG